MKLLGIEDERLRKEWISASEGTKFAEVVRDFTGQIVKLGPNPLRNRETAA
jgi:F420-non-reducing hydrogenase iron-sulfur subunit